MSAPGHPLAQRVQRIHGALQLGEFAVHFAHELMEMEPGLAHQRDGAVEAIHQEALAPADAAVQVDAARNVGPVDQLLQGVGALLLEVGPFAGAAIEHFDRPKLRRITPVATLGQLALVFGLDTQSRNPEDKLPYAKDAKVARRAQKNSIEILASFRVLREFFAHFAYGCPP
jgi:hypothetical protein